MLWLLVVLVVACPPLSLAAERLAQRIPVEAGRRESHSR